MNLGGVEVSFLTLDGLRHLALPAFTLSLIMMAMVIRLTRAGMREVLHADYIRFARANGIRESRVIGVHALKNILIPIVTVLGMEFGGVIAFAVVTESIFSWPGIGKMLIDAIAVLDRPADRGLPHLRRRDVRGDQPPDRHPLLLPRPARPRRGAFHMSLADAPARRPSRLGLFIAEFLRVALRRHRACRLHGHVARGGPRALDRAAGPLRPRHRLDPRQPASRRVSRRSPA